MMDGTGPTMLNPKPPTKNQRFAPYDHALLSVRQYMLTTVVPK
jgi:hypothetical protein